MANLITEKQKTEIKRDYVIRLSATGLLLVSLLGIFFLAYLVPYYLSVSKKDQRVAEQFKSALNAENKENSRTSVAQIVAQTLDELRAVELYTADSLVPSTYFTKIIGSKNANIKITRLTYTALKKGQGQFLVSGVAKNREGLVTFIDDLKVRAGFASVDSPVSDFAKDKDIAFTLNIKNTL